jgi:hypothetical protein
MRQLLTRVQSHIFIVLAVAVAVHFFVWFVPGGLGAPVYPLGDLNLYDTWTTIGLNQGLWADINEPAVYPPLSALPMLVAYFLNPANSPLGWFVMISALNVAGIGTLVRWGKGTPEAFRAAWFWIAFLLLLGPIGLARLDAVATGLDLFAVIAFSRAQYFRSMVFATAGVWIKVWPAVQALALVVAVKKRVRAVITAVVTTAVILSTFLVVGGNLPSMFNFLTAQTDRRIEYEAVIASPWLETAALGYQRGLRGGNPGPVRIVQNDILFTHEVVGPGTDFFAAHMNQIMILVLLVTAVLGFLAYRRGAAQNEVFAITGLAAVLGMIAFNKVGSPQYYGWIAVPLVACILMGVRKLKFPIIMALVLALITQIIYPFVYMGIMNLQLLPILLLIVRNALLVVFWVWAVYRLVALSRRPIEPANQ